MTRPKDSSTLRERGPAIWAAFFGIFFGLCLLKFGNPPIMEKYVEPPRNGFDLLASAPWPISWAWGLLVALIILALLAASFSKTAFLSPLPKSRKARLACVYPLFWLAWQFLSAGFSVSPELSRLTVIHFAACVACFYLGLFFLSAVQNLWPFWIGILCGFLLVLAIGIDQHFGGLAESRAFFYQQQKLYPGIQYPPELLKKVASDRIYSTLFYPNTLAGALLLFAPAALMTTVQAGNRWRLGNASRGQTICVLVSVCVGFIYLYILNSHAGWIFFLLYALCLVLPVPRWTSPVVLALSIVAVLFWSGSKAGWLIMLLLAVAALLRASSQVVPGTKTPRFAMSPRTKAIIISVLVLASLGGFFVRHLAFFKKGATSVSARFDYWRAALEIAKTHPLTGTGPGTFQIPYERIKRPDAEMARLTHNDYLQQASDSGIPGFLFYALFVATALAVIGRSTLSGAAFVIWLGLLGWALQCLVEFSLYIPALAWPAFALLGLALARSESKAKGPDPASTG